MIAGRARWVSPSQVRRLVWMPRTETVSPRPAVGSQRRTTAKSRISIMPFQKLGSEKPRMVLPMMMREGRLSGSRPA